MNFLLVCAGGAIGAGGRYLVNTLALRWFGSAFPWGTLTVNVAGSFAMGLLAVWLLTRADVPAGLRVFLLTGVLGGFTTFSAYSLDVAVLAERGDFALAGLYAAGSVVLSIAALLLGQWCARMFLG